MKPLIVSACLLGTACRYDGASKPADGIIKLKDKYNLIPVCPEIMGGLPTPRTPCEIKNGCVSSCDGFDRTAQYLKGANEVLRLARFFGCEAALLKERSPACGSGKIYDGSFSGMLTDGDGICAALLKKHGIKVYGESRMNELI